MSLGPFWTRTNQTKNLKFLSHMGQVLLTPHTLLKRVHKYEKLLEEFVISWEGVLWGMI